MKLDYRSAMRRARRRVRFHFVTEAIPMYEKPCGCIGGDDGVRLNHYLPIGIISYSYGWPGGDMDLCECRLCGAVWTQYDLQLDRARKEADRG